jgi:FO synthase
MQTEAQPASSLLSEILSGRAVSQQDAERLLHCVDSDLAMLLSSAQELRERKFGRVVSYSRKVFLPLTNLCRDYCGYCTFRRDPGQVGAHTMLPDEVLAVARHGEQLGCTEALFSLGDKPEAVFPEMRGVLRQLGYRSTLHYLEAMCELVLRETKLVPHANPGLLSYEWLGRLRDVSPSIGLMLESTNGSLTTHANAPDKTPAKRLAVIEDAGRLGIPFTTGILIGIGETASDRVESLFAIAELQRKYGHVQEVIIQNFRAKPEIPMANWPEPTIGDMLRTIAVARLILPDTNIQAPPNLSDDNFPRLLDAGINDWGGVSPVTPDFINPEKPWPQLVCLEARTAAKGFELRQRLPVYPAFLAKAKSTRAAAQLECLAGADGFAARTSGSYR